MGAVNGGTDFEIRNIEANNTTDTPIDFSTRIVNSVVIRCRTAVDLQIRKNQNDADYFTVPSGTTFTLNAGSRKINAFYVRSASATPTVEVIGIIG